MAKKASKAARNPSNRKVAKEPPSVSEIAAMGWEMPRARHIQSIMVSDGISYSRAVKRSRRRLINEGKYYA